MAIFFFWETLAGHQSCGGDSSSVSHQLYDVKEIQATTMAFAALRADGHIVTWGSPEFGGDSESAQGMLYDIQEIQSSRCAFAALREDGQVISWGGKMDTQVVDQRTLQRHTVNWVDGQ